MANKIASPVRELRKKLGMSQREFALLIGKSAGYLSDLEAGMTNLADDMLRELTAIGADTDELAERHRSFMEQKRGELRKASIEKLKGSQ